MSKHIAPIVGVFLLNTATLVVAQHHDHAFGGQEGATASAPQLDEKLPPGEEQAKAVLEKSPRHGEYVDIKVEGSEIPIRSWVVYPERKDKAGVVIVIHEIYGLSDWIRSVADQLAKDGFIAVAPDLISGKGPNGGGSDAVPNRDEVVKLIRGLAPEEVTTRLNAVRTYALKLPSANGKTATIGFCWGGARSFAYASAQTGLNAAAVYYGSAPEIKDLASIKAPVLGLYGSDDARVNATIDTTRAEMKKLGKVYDVNIYEGAGHGFLRNQTGREGANLKATQQAWPKTVEFLQKNLS